jgi:hypothetical protein
MLAVTTVTANIIYEYIFYVPWRLLFVVLIESYLLYVLAV